MNSFYHADIQLKILINELQYTTLSAKYTNNNRLTAFVPGQPG